MKLYLVFVQIMQSPHAICHLEKKTDERAGGLGCHEGEPGGDIIDDMNNPVAPAVISEVRMSV